MSAKHKHKVEVIDASGDGTGPWRVEVNGYGIAMWPSSAGYRDPKDYANVVAIVLRNALKGRGG